MEFSILIVDLEAIYSVWSLSTLMARKYSEPDWDNVISWHNPFIIHYLFPLPVSTVSVHVTTLKYHFYVPKKIRTLLNWILSRHWWLFLRPSELYDTLKPRILKLEFKIKMIPPSSYPEYQQCDAINLCILFKCSNILILRICSIFNILWMQMKLLCCFLGDREKKICRWIKGQRTQSLELVCFVH